MFYLKDYLGTFGPGDTRPLTPREFQLHLIRIARAMYANGWTVVGSKRKKACLRPWGVADRETLFRWAQEDLFSGRADALNLRLRDNQVIAIDCDVYDPEFTDAFLKKLIVLLGLSKEQLFTTVGGKGYKVFFRREDDERWPSILGMAFCGTEKQMVEIKNHLSTAAGVYNDDYAIYHPLAGTQFITKAKPQDLPILNPKFLPLIKRIFLEMCADFGYTNSKGQLVVLPWLQQAVRLVLARFFVEFKDRLDEVLRSTELPAQWRAFCELQGSKVYKQALNMCFRFDKPTHPTAAYLQCQDVIASFELLAEKCSVQVQSDAHKFDNITFADYTSFLRRLLLAESPERPVNDLDVYSKFLTMRGVKF